MINDDELAKAMNEAWGKEETWLEKTNKEMEALHTEHFGDGVMAGSPTGFPVEADDKEQLKLYAPATTENIEAAHNKIKELIKENPVLNICHEASLFGNSAETFMEMNVRLLKQNKVQYYLNMLRNQPHTLKLPDGKNLVKSAVSWINEHTDLLFSWDEEKGIYVPNSKLSLAERMMPIIDEITKLNFKLSNAVAKTDPVKDLANTSEPTKKIRKKKNPASDVGKAYMAQRDAVDKEISTEQDLLDAIAKPVQFKSVQSETDRTIRLTILGEPTAQKRHRSVKMGNFVRQYDPSAADKGDFLSVVQNNAPEKPFDCPLMLQLTFYFTRPKSHYKTGKNAHILKDTCPSWHLSKPDSDNLAKFVMDGLNKIFWRDDSLLCDVRIQKKYDTNPRVEIIISPLI